MTVLLELLGTLTTGTPPAPSLTLEVGVNESPEVAPANLLLELTLDDTPGQMSRPPAGTVQVVGFEVDLDGTPINFGTLSPNLEVHLTYDNILGDFTFSAPLPSPIGNPSTYLGPAPGLHRIDIYGIYLTSTGVHKIPLISNGIVTREERSIETDGSRVVQYTGSDAGGRFDRKRITLYLPPGHGFTRPEVVTLMAELAGAGGAATGTSQKMYHPVALIDSEWIPPAKDMMALSGRILHWETDGSFSTPVDGFDGSSPSLNLTKQDVLRAQRITLDVNGDVVTKIIATGNASVVTDTQTKTTRKQVVEVYGPYAPVQLGLSQRSDGTFGTTGAVTGTATQMLISRTTTISEYDGTSLISQVITNEGWYNPISARYIQQSDGTWLYVVGCFLPTGTATDDTAQAFTWQAEKFVCTGRSETVYTFDVFNNNYLKSEVTRTDKPMLALADLRFRSSSNVAWDVSSFETPRFMLGSKAGVVALASTLQPNSALGPSEVPVSIFSINPGVEKTRVEIDYTVDALGFIHQQRKTTYDYLTLVGPDYLYAGGFEGAAATQSLQPSQVETTSYAVAVGDSYHDEIVTTQTYGANAGVTTTVTEGVDGSLPAAAQLKDLVPPQGIYTNPAQAAELARAASPLQSQPIEATFENYFLEEDHPQYEELLSSQWAESPAELQAWEVYLIREGAAATFVAAVPANFFITPGTVLSFAFDVVDFLGYGVDVPFDVWVRDVRHRLSGIDGPFLTIVTGRVYFAT